MRPAYARSIENQVAQPDFASTYLFTSANALIAKAENLLLGSDKRALAVGSLVMLVDQQPEVLDLIFEMTNRYISDLLHIDDACPYPYSGFDILKQVKRQKSQQCVVRYLEKVVSKSWGCARWSAIRTLCVFNCPEAKQVLERILKGEYPPPFLEHSIDVQIILNLRGK